MKSHCALLTALLLGAAIPANASIGTSDGAPHAGAMSDQSYMQLARIGGGGGVRAGGGHISGGGGYGGNIRGGSSASINHTTNINISGNNIHNGNNYNGGNNIHGETYHGGAYYNHWDDHYYHPVAAGIAIGTAAAVTAAVVGSVVYSVPSTCGTVIVNGFSYYQCGSVWYRPQYAGSSVQYVVVTAPR